MKFFKRIRKSTNRTAAGFPSEDESIDVSPCNSGATNQPSIDDTLSPDDNIQTSHKIDDELSCDHKSDADIASIQSDRATDFGCTNHNLTLDQRKKIIESAEYYLIDELFIAAGELVIKKDKGSIGMLQRELKIGFNRAARIVGQLSDTGVIDWDENSTKPGVVLMSIEEFYDHLNDPDHFFRCYVHAGDALERVEALPQMYDECISEPDVSITEDVINDSVDYSHDGELLYTFENTVIPNAPDGLAASFINSLVKYNSPEKLKLILIDKYQLEFMPYQRLQHLFIPIVSNEEKISGIISWTCAEVKDRINRFLEVHAQDLTAYNQKSSNKLPTVVIIANEIYGLHLENIPELNEVLLNSRRVGVVFFFFSKVSLKTLSFNENKEFWKIGDAYQIFHSIKGINDLPVTQNFDSMDGHTFEYFCAELLKKNGYDSAEVTCGSGDQGIDILATKDGIKFGIQCKCYSSSIGNKAVQEAFSGKTYYHCQVAIVLTNQYFTESAKKLAESNNVILWDRDQLQRFVEGKKI